METNEEYKYFRFGKKQKYDDRSRKYDNIKDPNEPFFNSDKGKYRTSKRNQSYLDPLNLSVQEWNEFLHKLNKRGFYIEYSFPYEGWPKSNSIYYEFPLEGDDEGRSNKIYFFPDKKVSTVVWNKTKKIIKFKNDSPDLDAILDYFYTLKKDPKTEQEERNKKYRDEAEKKIDYLTSEDNPSYADKLPHHSEDTSTFDSYKFKNLKSFESFSNL